MLGPYMVTVDFGGKSELEKWRFLAEATFPKENVLKKKDDHKEYKSRDSKPIWQ